MENIMPEIPGVAVIMFMNWVAVSLGLPRKLAPVLALVMGIFIAVFTYQESKILDIIYYGTFLAASAVGFHSGSKNTVQQIRTSMDKNKNS